MLATLASLVFLDGHPVREMRLGIERRYRVVIDQEGGDHYAYRFEGKIVAPKVPKGVAAEVQLAFKLTDYHATMSGQSTSAKLIGGGQVPLDPSGLPAGLNIAGSQGPVWLPLLALYAPPAEDGAFDVPTVPVGTGLFLTGKGTRLRKRSAVEVDLDATILRGDRTIGTLKIATVLDREGWPQRSEGTLVSDDGTYRFRLG